ncbi:MAG: PhoH family protein [Flavobacteriaceae bacterium]|nr:PhoH family protein [Flavobacteriaceae bacterium]
MSNIEIELTDINPRDFYGDKNINVELIKECFPELKIIARDNKLKAYGEELILNNFKDCINRLINHFLEFNNLKKEFVKSIISNIDESGLNNLNSKDIFILNGIRGKVIKAITLNQQKILNLNKINDLLFVLGPSGTGKTYTSVALAVRALKNKQVKRIILTRPAVEAGENLGFLPGDLKEKLDPYMQPLYDALFDMIPKERLKKLLEIGIIQIAPLAFMRGRTLDDAFVILDEAQNTTNAQMKMFLTRMGKNAKFIITGDLDQIDLPRKSVSGLEESVSIIDDIDGVGVLYLDDKDVIRHTLVKKIIKAYKKNDL